MGSPVGWVSWPWTITRGSLPGSVVRLGLRALAWGRDPSSLVHGGGAVGVSAGLAVSLSLVLAIWVVGPGHRRPRRKPDRAHPHRGSAPKVGRRELLGEDRTTTDTTP